MKLFYDLRLGYLVSAPGIDSPITLLQSKAGDGDEIILQFGRSSDPNGSSSIVDSPTWTAENLPGGTVISAAIKEDGKFSDGEVLAATSTFANDSGAFTYTGELSLNTEEINTAMLRDDADAENDVESLSCQFEVTFQIGGSGPWRSSVLPVPFTIYHDIISGDEATPTAASDPAEYLLKASGIEWLPTVTSKTGGTSADLDAVPTVAVAVGKVVQFADADSSDLMRVYQLTAGTDAESSPAVIRPDDYAPTTNEKVWLQRQIDGDLLLPAEVSQVEAEAGTSTDARTWTPERVKQAIEALESPTVAEPPNGLSSSVANEVVLFNGTDGKQLKRATTTGLAKLTSGVLSAATPGTDYANVGAITGAGLTMATARLIGRTTASTGAPEEITVGAGLSLTGGALTGEVLPGSVITLTTDTTLLVGTHNKTYMECTGAMTTVTIAPQGTSTWTDNSHMWIVNRLASGSITLAPGSGVTLISGGSSGGSVTLTNGSYPVHIWRSASNVWRVIS